MDKNNLSLPYNLSGHLTCTRPQCITVQCYMYMTTLFNIAYNDFVHVLPPGKKEL